MSIDVSTDVTPTPWHALYTAKSRKHQLAQLLRLDNRLPKIVHPIQRFSAYPDTPATRLNSAWIRGAWQLVGEGWW